jgi:hypothetical protein
MPVFAVPAAATSEIEPSRQKFPNANLVNIPYFDVQPSALIDFTESFASTAPFTKYSESTPGTFTVSGSEGIITHTGVGSNLNDIITETASSYSMPQAFVSIRVDSTPVTSTGFDNSGVGLVKDANNFIFASIDRANNVGRIQIKIAGTNTFLASVTKTWVAPFKIALSLVANSAYLWADTGSGWQVVTSATVTSTYDFRTVGNLTGWKAGFTLASQNASQWNFSQFQSGRFGGVGMRDMVIVTAEDGTPYVNGTKVTFTATAVDPAGTGHTGVFTLDLSNNTIAQVGEIMVNRSGKVFNDLSAHIIRYVNGDRRLFIATWGNDVFGGGSLQILHELFSGTDILSGTNVVSGMTQLTIPQTGTVPGVYDPMVVKFNGTWYMAYTNTLNVNFTGNPFFTCLASSPDLATWTSVGTDSGHTGYEGSRLLVANKKLWVMSGGPAGSGNTARIYDSTMTFISNLNATFNTGTHAPPHPMVFPYLNDFALLTFDGTTFGGVFFTTGQPNVQVAARYW